jgi:hypothetical protein
MKGEYYMANNDHKANQNNSNPSTSGTNHAYQKMLDNRSRQLNTQDTKFTGHKGK